MSNFSEGRLPSWRQGQDWSLSISRNTFLPWRLPNPIVEVKLMISACMRSQNKFVLFIQTSIATDTGPIHSESSLLKISKKDNYLFQTSSSMRWVWQFFMAGISFDLTLRQSYWILHFDWWLDLTGGSNKRGGISIQALLFRTRVLKKARWTWSVSAVWSQKLGFNRKNMVDIDNSQVQLYFQSLIPQDEVQYLGK